MKAVIKKQQSRLENSLVIYPVIMKDVFFAGIAIKLKSVVNREQKNRKKE